MSESNSSEDIREPLKNPENKLLQLDSPSGEAEKFFSKNEFLGAAIIISTTTFEEIKLVIFPLNNQTKAYPKDIAD